MGGMSYTEWKLGDKSVAGMLAMPDMVPAEVPAHWLVYFAVDDTDGHVICYYETRPETGARTANHRCRQDEIWG